MNFQENFQNVSDYDSIDLDKEEYEDVNEEFEDVKEEFEDVNEEFEDITQEEQPSYSQGTINNLNAQFTKSSKVKSSNDKQIEGFEGGSNNKYNESKLVLKSILFGLLFYLLSNQKIYNLTRPYLNGLDKNLVHSIVFIILFYLINIVI